MSLLKADTIKPVTSSGDLSLQGDSGGSAVDCLNITSAGDINFTGNTDAKIKLPSAGGIYESDGSTPILTESGGTVTLANVSLTLPSGSVLQTIRYEDTEQLGSATTSVIVSSASQTIDMTSGNILVVWFSGGTAESESTTSGNAAFYGPQITIGASSTFYPTIWRTSGSGVYRSPITVMASIVAGSTATHTIKRALQADAGTPYWNVSGNSVYWLIQEIKA